MFPGTTDKEAKLFKFEDYVWPGQLSMIVIRFDYYTDDGDFYLFSMERTKTFQKNKEFYNKKGEKAFKVVFVTLKCGRHSAVSTSYSTVNSLMERTSSAPSFPLRHQ